MQSCGSSSTDASQTEQVMDIAHHEEEASDQISMTKAQIEAIGLHIGGFSETKLAGYIKANGILDLPPSNRASIHAPQAGFIQKARYLEGDYVKKGAVLVALQHPDFIQLQQTYQEVSSRLIYLTQEFNRQQTLAAANVSAKKKLQETEAEFNALSATKNGLAQQLSYLGLSPKKAEEGEIQTSIVIRAPFSGYITRLNIHLGQYVSSDIPLYEMVDNQHLHLELNVFEKDLFKVKKEQRITFRLPAQGPESYEAEVHLVGKEFDQENRTVRIHGHLLGNHPEFVRGLYAEAKIWLDARTVPTLPETAIVSEEGQAYIFAEVQENESHEESEAHDEKQFRKVLVRTGITENGFTEVYPVEPLGSNDDIVLSGAYYLMAEMNKGEADHDH